MTSRATTLAPHGTAPPPRNLRPHRAYRAPGRDRHRGVRDLGTAQPRGRGRAMDARAGDSDRRGYYAAAPAPRRSIWCCPALCRPGTRRRFMPASTAI